MAAVRKDMWPSWMFKRATCLKEDFFGQHTFLLEMWKCASLASLTIKEMYIQIVGRGFAYKVVNFFLVLFLMMISNIVTLQIGTKVSISIGNIY